MIPSVWFQWFCCDINWQIFEQRFGGQWEGLGKHFEFSHAIATKISFNEIDR